MQQVDSSKTEKGFILGLVIISVLIGLILLFIFIINSFESASTRKTVELICFGIYLYTWGILFSLSNLLTHRSFIFRAIMWLGPMFAPLKRTSMTFQHSIIFFGTGSIFMIIGLGNLIGIF